MPGRFVFRRLPSGQPLDHAVAPDAAHPVQPQQIACIVLHAWRKTFHATWKVHAFLEALSFLTNLRLPSVIQHLRHPTRVDDAADLPHSQAARALMNTMLEFFAAHRYATVRERMP
ncbi:hypothetical protein [Burkholderia diffusa]|uniref:hypothetical protein n=1 Tax=Burkholderia diffusa TaxID=488732 RepID=UPI002ABEA167|nr:hypothetical protein [Burkholderia diffusa]